MALGIAAGWVALLWIVTNQGGAVGIARSDDWSYLLTQFDFARTGTFVMNNWAVTMLIGQTIAAAPVVAIFGESIVALQAFVAVCAVLALVMTYVVLRCALPSVWSLLSVALLAMSPIFGPSAVSFMTDVPALLFLSLSLWFGIRAVDGSANRPWIWFIGSAVFSLIAFTFRDYALLCFAPVVLVVMVRSRDARGRVLAGALGLAVALIAAVAYSWRHSLPNDLRLEGWPLDFGITLVARGLLTVSLLVLPVLAALRWREIRLANRFIWIGVVAGAVVCAGALLALARLELLGNVIHPYGSTWLISGSGVRMWPLWFNRVLILLAVAAFTSLLIALVVALLKGVGGVRRLTVTTWMYTKPHEAVIALFPLIILGAHAGATVVLGTWFIDRYFILFLAYLAAALLMLGRAQDWLVLGWQRVIPFAVLFVYALVGIHVTDFDARFDGARWSVGERLVKSGYPAESIDAGMQWVSFHARSIGLGAQDVPVREGRTWWTERYPDQVVCATAVAQEGAVESRFPQPLYAETVRTLFGRSYSLTAILGPDRCPGAA